MVRNAMSATEFYILQYLWTRETPATFAEIMVHFNEVEKKAWKKQTVNTFLSRLSQKGFLNIDKSGKRAIYIPSVFIIFNVSTPFSTIVFTEYSVRTIESW